MRETLAYALVSKRCVLDLILVQLDWFKITHTACYHAWGIGWAKHVVHLIERKWIPCCTRGCKGGLIVIRLERVVTLGWVVLWRRDVIGRAFTSAILIPDVAWWVIFKILMDVMSGRVGERLWAGLRKFIIAVEILPVADWICVRYANLRRSTSLFRHLLRGLCVVILCSIHTVSSNHLRSMEWGLIVYTRFSLDESQLWAMSTVRTLDCIMLMRKTPY